MSFPLHSNRLTRRGMALLLGGTWMGGRAARLHASTGLWPAFPQQNPDWVRDIVGAAHRNLDQVKALVEAHPSLANAAYDGGFGDWETPLGAAAHTGQRAIAEYLLANGARLDIFAAAMLGMTDAVKGMVSAQPGVQRVAGPHGIPLLSHARAGGERARDTLAYLQSLGDAGSVVATQPLAADRKSVYVGKYAMEESPGPLSVNLPPNGQLTVQGPGGSARLIHYLGNDEFYPSGVPSMRLRFEIQDGKATSVTLTEKGWRLVGKRVGS